MSYQAILHSVYSLAPQLHILPEKEGAPRRIRDNNSLRLSVQDQALCGILLPIGLIAQPVDLRVTVEPFVELRLRVKVNGDEILGVQVGGSPADQIERQTTVA